MPDFLAQQSPARAATVPDFAYAFDMTSNDWTPVTPSAPALGPVTPSCPPASCPAPTCTCKWDGSSAHSGGDGGGYGGGNGGAVNVNFQSMFTGLKLGTS